MYDAVIIGAGPAGSATAHYLAQQGLAVLLLDRADFPRDKTCGDGLTPRALAVLDDMGILDEVQHLGQRINGLEVFAPNRRVTAAPIPRRPEVPPHALVVPRLVLDNTIRERALASGAEFRGQVAVTGLEPRADGVVVKAECQGHLAAFQARMAIIATGANVKLLRRIGLLPEMPAMMLAARAYFEDVRGLSDRFLFRFDGVPLPGYGWVFPLSRTSANVGLGVTPWNRSNRPGLVTPRAAFDAFIHTPPLQEMLDRARQVGPVMGYPLRVDFLTAPTFGERVLLVGEAAGLVNPLTGEGIDYALESGKLAAEHLAWMFEAGDFSRQSLEAYDQLLRRRFQSLFLFCTRVRDLCLNRVCLNWLVRTAARRGDLSLLLTNIVLGNQAVPENISLKKVLNVLLAR